MENKTVLLREICASIKFVRTKDESGHVEESKNVMWAMAFHFDPLHRFPYCARIDPRTPMTSCKRRPSITAVSFLLIASHSREYQASAFSTLSLKRRRPSCSVPHAKRKNKRGDDSQDLNQWYDSVDDDATPDEVFWQEMERQRLFSDISKDQDSTRDPYAVAASGASSDMPMSGMNSGGTAGGAFNTAASVGGGNNGMNGGINPANMAPKRKPPNMYEQKAADATLSEYTLFQVEDNWLDERLIEQMEAMKVVREDEGDLSIEEETRRLEEQLEALPDGFGDQRELLMERNEPWDHFGDEEKEIEPGREGIRQVPEPTPGTFVAKPPKELISLSTCISHQICLTKRFGILLGR